MTYQRSIGLMTALWCLCASAWPQSPRDGLLVLVDHAATSAEAADVCEQRAPGAGTAIRDAHARWQTQHSAAQNNLLELMLKDVQAKAESRGDSAQGADKVLALFRTASLDKLRQSMRAMNEQRIAQFCADYPSQFDKPEMDFTTLWLRERSRR